MHVLHAIALNNALPSSSSFHSNVYQKLYSRSCYADCSFFLVLAVFVVRNDSMIIVQVPGEYFYTRVVQLTLTNQQSIQVIAKFSNDVFIALTTNPDSYKADTMYEIHIGANSNTQSLIRYITVTILAIIKVLI